MGKTKGLMERLAAGETVIVAEGYLFEFEARGYLKAGGYVPEVVLEYPDLVRNLHQEFVHAGSDVVLAFTYYAHREKLRLIGKENVLEEMNRTALKIAREVADETGTLMAGNLSNSTIYKPDDPQVHEEIYNMCVEQVKWAVEGGADFIVAETFSFLDEALIALKAIKDHGKGLPAVVTLSWKERNTSRVAMACRTLEEAGAAVVGLNCTHGPATMLPLLKEIRKEYQGPLAALPVVYRTDEAHPVFQSLVEVDNPNANAFPLSLDAHQCSRKQITEFSLAARDLGVQYLGLCCGNRSYYMRSMAEAIGRTPPASRFSPDMSIHFSYMKDDRYQYTKEKYAQDYKIN